MGDQKIDGFYSEYSIKDNASDTIAKIAKGEKELQKGLKAGNKDIKDREKSLQNRAKEEEKAAKAAEKNAKAEALRRSKEQKDAQAKAKQDQKTAAAAKKNAEGKVAGAAGAVGAAASGSVIGEVAKLIPLGLGAAFVGAVVALEKAAAAIEKSASVQGEKARAGRAASAISMGGKFSGFAQKDIESALAALGEAGVSKITQKQIDILQAEGKRVGSLGEAVKNVLSGSGFRTLGESGRNLESISENIASTAQTAQFRFETITGLLGDVQKNNQKLLADQQRVTGTTRELTYRALENQRKQDNRDLKLAQSSVVIGGKKRNIDYALNLERDIEAGAVNLGAKGATALGAGVQKLESMMNRGKASGGAVYAGQPTLVGENGPEIFNPGANGNVVPMSRARATGGFSIGALTFNVSGAGNPQETVALIKREFVGLLNEYANTTFAQELGLNRGM